LAIANALAYSVAGSVKAQGKIFEQTRFSDKRASENYVMNFSSKGLNNQSYPSLGIGKIYVLVTGGTCSASESFINGLRGIDVEVELIGSTTCGKPYGFYPQDNCGITYAAMEMEAMNAKGEGGFSEGMMPQCAAIDDLSRPLGDASEGMLSIAMRLILICLSRLILLFSSISVSPGFLLYMSSVSSPGKHTSVVKLKFDS
jgi:hypothetical protein